MAWNFDGTDDHIAIADSAVLTIPSAAVFALGGWVKVPSNAGTGTRYFMSWGGYGAVPSINFLLYQASHASLANRLELNFRGTAIRPTSTDPGTDTAWQHFLITRTVSTNVIIVWRNGTSIGSSSNSGDCDVAASWYIGDRSAFDRTFGGQMAEWFKIDRDLSAREITGLASGMSPSDLPGIYDATSWYLPMYGDAYVDVMDRLAITNNGTTTARHPPVQMPFARRQTRRIVADTVTFSPAWAAQPGLVGGVIA